MSAPELRAISSSRHSPRQPRAGPQSGRGNPSATSSRGWSGKSHERGCDRVAGEDEGRGRACIALPRAGKSHAPGQPGATQKKEPPVPAARSVKQGGVKVQRWLDDAPINDRETLTRT